MSSSPSVISSGFPPRIRLSIKFLMADPFCSSFIRILHTSYKFKSRFVLRVCRGVPVNVSNRPSSRFSFTLKPRFGSKRNILRFFFSYMGVVKSTYWISKANQMFLHRDQFQCVQIYTYAEAENTKDFRKELINYFLFWKVKKSGVSQGVQYGSILSLHIDISLGGWYWYYVINDICNHVLCNKCYYM